MAPECLKDYIIMGIFLNFNYLCIIYIKIMWLYKGKNYSEIHDSKLVGFVYLMTYLPTGQKYIGKKNFYSTRKVVKTKKELALITDKRLSKKKIVTKESNWKTYKSSNDFLKGCTRSSKT